ncbi:MAG: peptidoglycan DD-metalloendopeptidase family protein [Rhodocyclaceae bacterium]|nr:peptidoglycan DD-metalloendopeptidase family protein [Rhodocyclaceae bacterium]
MAVLTVALLAGCASHAPAPVVERGAPAAPPAPVAKAAIPVPVAGEGRILYTVKKGDTLYSIALEHGHDYKDISAWNNIENPNRIQVGQQLRVSPPESEAPVAVAKPVVSSAPVEAKAAGANTETYKREPRGGKVAYSEQALAQMREPAPGPAQPADRPVEKPADKPAEKAAVAPTGDDAIDWAWPSSGKTLAGFADGAAGKESSKGIDIAGRTGEPVHAAAEGIVSYVGSGLRGYGNLVVIRHNATYLTVYAHNSRILVKEKQAIAKGQKIAEIGSSDADQTKLHFEIRRQGKPVDPLKYLPAR